MRTLILFRHAKAASPAPGQGDFDRPLTERGRSDAGRMGTLLAGYPIDLALVSASQRTRETWTLASAALRPEPHAEISRTLYLCGAHGLIGAIQDASDSVNGLVVVAHNPDTHEVAQWLAGASQGDMARNLAQKFPTAAVAIFAIAPGVEWSGLGPKVATLLKFTTPAETRTD
jgi:phosphohistidine phosphatase